MKPFGGIRTVEKVAKLIYGFDFVSLFGFLFVCLFVCWLLLAWLVVEETFRLVKLMGIQ